MACSPARLLANRANALKSSGPKTAGGKERSRANAVKHGLTGAGIALPTEDAAEVERRFSAMERELKPEGELAGYLVRRVAGLTIRVERCMRHESKMSADRVRHAVDDHDERRAVEVEGAFARLSTDPAASARALLRTPEGTGRMIEAWLGIKDDLARKQPTRSARQHLELAENLMGRRAADLPISRAGALCEAICLNFRFLDDHDGAELDPSGHQETRIEPESQARDVVWSDPRPMPLSPALPHEGGPEGSRHLFAPPFKIPQARLAVVP